MAKWTALCLFLAMTPAFGQMKAQSPSGETEVRAALNNFLTAFDNLEWDKFRLAFVDDATVFYPRAMPDRADARAQFEAGFKKVFEQIRGDRTAAPYLHIEPKELQIKMLGNVAIITFHLDDRPGFLNRRTVVMTKTEAGWKIVHLHASEVATEMRR